MENLLKEIKEQEDRIECVNNFKNSLLMRRPPKPLIWETDIKKIDISQLRNGADLKHYTFLRVETVSLEEEEEGQTLEDLINSYDTSYLNLITLIEKGVKIIPPVYVERPVWIDGELKLSPMVQFDGGHRTRIAKAYGLEEMPVLVYEGKRGTFDDRYLFTPNKWSFEVDKETDSKILIAKSKDGKKEITLRASYVASHNKELVEIGVIHSSY